MTERHARRVLSLTAATCAALALPLSVGADDGRDEVRATGTCSGPGSVELRLRADDGAIRVELEIESSRPGSRWSVILLHERRIAYRGALRASRSGSVKLKRTVPDWYGSDSVTTRATGPRSQMCRVSATLQ